MLPYECDDGGVLCVDNVVSLCEYLYNLLLLISGTCRFANFNAECCIHVLYLAG